MIGAVVSLLAAFAVGCGVGFVRGKRKTEERFAPDAEAAHLRDLRETLDTVVRERDQALAAAATHEVQWIEPSPPEKPPWKAVKWKPTIMLPRAAALEDFLHRLEMKGEKRGWDDPQFKGAIRIGTISTQGAGFRGMLDKRWSGLRDGDYPLSFEVPWSGPDDLRAVFESFFTLHDDLGAYFDETRLLRVQFDGEVGGWAVEPPRIKPTVHTVEVAIPRTEVVLASAPPAQLDDHARAAYAELEEALREAQEDGRKRLKLVQ